MNTVLYNLKIQMFLCNQETVKNKEIYRVGVYPKPFFLRQYSGIEWLFIFFFSSIY